MNINIFFSKERIAYYGFVIVFPFFILYHTLIAFSIINPVFGSLLAGAASVIILLFFINFIFSMRLATSNNNIYNSLVWFFYFYCFLWSLIHYIFNGHKEYISSSFFQVVGSLVVSLCMYFIGRFIVVNKIWKIGLITVFSFFTFLMLYTLSTGNLSFMPNRVGGAEDVVASYQAFSGLFLVLGILLLVISRSIVFKLIIYLLVSIIIFYLGSRSEFIAFILGGFIYIVFFTEFKHKLYLSIVLIPVIFFILLSFDREMIFLSNSRIFELTDIESSSSWNSRQDLNTIAVQQIQDSPFLGFFGGHAYYFGSTGAYAHNFLSSWVSYGFIGFISFISLIFFPLVTSIKLLFLEKKINNREKIIFLLSLLFLLLLLFSKSVYWIMPSFLWGFFVSRNKVN